MPRPKISCLIPSYNEEESIASVLEALLRQTRLPDTIHVLVNNTTDLTIDVIREFMTEFPGVSPVGEDKWAYGRVVRNEEFNTIVTINNLGSVKDKKVGALNAGYVIALAEDADYYFGVDGDTQPHPECLEHLEAEMVDEPRIGGISAIYSIGRRPKSGLFGKFLILGQRQAFAQFHMDQLLRDRRASVLGGQSSLFNMKALADVQVKYHQAAPWVRDSEVEDSKLTLQLRDTGYLTKFSAKARAYADPMLTLKSLDAQQVKWGSGFIDLFWPGERGNHKGQPWHANLRQRWYETMGMAVNIISRIGFLLLLLASVSIDAFEFKPVWLVIPAVAMLLSLKTAHSMHDRKIGDYLFALLYFPTEIYLWLRAGHFLRSWTHFISRSQKDTWAAQAAAEKGRGGLKWLAPLLGVLSAMGLAVWGWMSLKTGTQGYLLTIGWPVLFVLTIGQTVTMVRKLIRRTRGYLV